MGTSSSGDRNIKLYASYLEVSHFFPHFALESTEREVMSSCFCQAWWALYMYDCNCSIALDKLQTSTKQKILWLAIAIVESSNQFKWSCDMHVNLHVEDIHKSFLLSFDANDPFVSKRTVRAFLMRVIHTSTLKGIFVFIIWLQTGWCP